MDDVTKLFEVMKKLLQDLPTIIAKALLKADVWVKTWSAGKNLMS